MINALVLIPLNLVANIYGLLYFLAIGLITIFFGAHLWEAYPYETWMAIGALVFLSKVSKLLVDIRIKKSNNLNGNRSFSELTLVAFQHIFLLAAVFVIGTGVIRLVYYYFIPLVVVLTVVIIIAFIFDYFKPFFVK